MNKTVKKKKEKKKESVILEKKYLKHNLDFAENNFGIRIAPR